MEWLQGLESTAQSWLTALPWFLRVMGAGVVMFQLLLGLGAVTFRRIVTTNSLAEGELVLVGGACAELVWLSGALVLIFYVFGTNDYLEVVERLEASSLPTQLIGAGALAVLYSILRWKLGPPSARDDLSIKSRRNSFIIGFTTSFGTFGVFLSLATFTWLGIMPRHGYEIALCLPLAFIGGVGFWGGALYLLHRYGNLVRWSERFYRWTLRFVLAIILFLGGSYLWSSL